MHILLMMLDLHVDNLQSARQTLPTRSDMAIIFSINYLGSET